MSEKNEKREKGSWKHSEECCKCGLCGGMYCCGGSKRLIVRVILGAAVLAVVFWGGFKLGELNGYLGWGWGMGQGPYGFPGRSFMMRGFGNPWYDGYGMMGGWRENANTPQSATTSPQ